MPSIRKQMAASAHTIVESNSILRFLRPDVFASVLDPAIADFKPSALRYLDRADALLVSSQASAERTCGLPGRTCLPGVSFAQWPTVSRRMVESIPTFDISPPTYHSADFIEFVRAKLRGLARESA